MFALLKMLVVWVPLGSLAGLIGIPWTILTGNIQWLNDWALRVVRLGLKAAGVTVEIVGLDRIPAGRAVIFMSNHVSNMDPPVLIPALPGRTSVMLKRELMAIPILGYAMKLGGYVPVERAARRESAQASVAAASAALAKGLHLLVFPEGTRSKDGRVAGFKKGPFFLAQQSGAPVIPTAISGTERMMVKGRFELNPGRARVEFLAPLNPADYPTREALSTAVRAAILAALPESMRPLPASEPAAGSLAVRATSESR